MDEVLEESGHPLYETDVEMEEDLNTSHVSSLDNSIISIIDFGEAEVQVERLRKFADKLEWDSPALNLLSSAKKIISEHKPVAWSGPVFLLSAFAVLWSSVLSCFCDLQETMYKQRCDFRIIFDLIVEQIWSFVDFCGDFLSNNLQL